jgi:hypothetical protein
LTRAGKRTVAAEPAKFTTQNLDASFNVLIDIVKVMATESALVISTLAPMPLRLLFAIEDFYSPAKAG